jgi:hypothetical protein
MTKQKKTHRDASQSHACVTFGKFSFWALFSSLSVMLSPYLSLLLDMVSFECRAAFKASFKKNKREKRALASQLCRVRARASSGRREESKDVGRE